MRSASISICAMICLTGCGGPATRPSPTAPVIRSLSVSPMIVGIEGATRFTFSAAIDAPGGEAAFGWQFGDGNGSTTAGPVSHVYQRAGNYVAQLTASNASGSSAITVNVRVASMVGTWVGAVTGHTRYPPNRPIPISQFQLNILQPIATVSLGSLTASWSDNAGCRENSAGRIRGHVGDPAAIQFGIEQLLCNDGDMYFSGSADPTGNSFSGTCQQGGPDCRFVMVRQ